MAIAKITIRINEGIRVPQVRLVDQDGNQAGVVSIQDALKMAKDAELDLVEVAAQAAPPVCRIMDFSRFKYDQEKKERRVKKSQKIAQLKQIRVKPHIDEHDYQTKLKQTVGFLNKKDKVKVNLFFQGREMAFRDKGKIVLERFVVDTTNIAQVEKDVFMEGRVMSIVLSPKADK